MWENVTLSDNTIESLFESLEDEGIDIEKLKETGLIKYKTSDKLQEFTGLYKVISIDYKRKSVLLRQANIK